MAGPQWRLIPVEIDGVKDTVVGDFAIGSDGTPWVGLAQPEQAICYWREGQWHKLPGQFSIDAHVRQLHISPTGRVYLSQVARHDNRRQRPATPYAAPLYLLHDGQARHVTDYYHKSDQYGRPLFFDSRGRIWNWGETFLAKFEDGQWRRLEANIGKAPQIVEDAAGNVYLFGRTLCYYRDGQFTLNAELPPFPWEQLNLKCARWGEDKALFISCFNQGAIVVDLKTLTVSDVLGSAPLPRDAWRQLNRRNRRGDGAPLRDIRDVPLLARARPWDLFRDTEGDVWVLASVRGVSGHFYLRVRAADNSVEERRETAAIDWGDNGIGSYGKPVLCARDGTICFGTRRDGVYLQRGGVLSHVSWQQGLSINGVNWICEHPDRTMWFASRQMGIAVYDPWGVEGIEPASSYRDSWTEYPLAPGPVVRDFQGDLWCCLGSEPGTISHWDGHIWEHLPLGHDQAHVSSLWVDNLRRVHVFGCTSPTGPTFACRLAGEQVDGFAGVREMLVDSVKTGSRRFAGNNPGTIPAPVVISDRELWCAGSSASRPRRYSAGSWSDIELGSSFANIFIHKNNQVLFGSRDGFMTWDRGQLVEFANEQTRNREYLLSESGLQPFDKNIYESHSTELFPARRTDDALYVFNDLTDFHRFQEDDIPAHTAKFSEHLDRIWLAAGGFWAHSHNYCRLERYYEGLLLTVDLAATPVAADFSAGHCDVYEQPAGDLWLRRRQTRFRVKRPKLETRIVAPQATQWASPTLRIEFAGAADGPLQEPLQYAWRLDDGPWSEPTERQVADLEFTQPGPHTFEVLSIGPMANLDTTPAVMTLDVTLPVPEVRIVSSPQDVVTDLDVAIAYEVFKQPEGAEATFQWRLDDGNWQETRETLVRLPRLGDGEHVFEVRGVGDGKYIQAPPASATFTVKVDYEKAINSALAGLRADDYGQREASARRLVSLGDRCVPYLREQLQTDDDDTQWWIQAVLAEIEGR